MTILISGLVLLGAVSFSYNLGRKRGRAQGIEVTRFWRRTAVLVSRTAKYWKESAKDWEHIAGGRVVNEGDAEVAFAEIRELERIYRAS